ncbi:MAG: ComEA family DNA-binding protein [Candidatus Omnitrophota bacterium]
MIKFTRDEKIAILFLLFALFAGTSALYYKRSNPTACRFTNFSEKEIEVSRSVDINDAPLEELTKLKHIGPVLAERIIAYRQAHGPFKEIGDIKKVKGIGDKIFDKIKNELLLE